MKPQVITIQKFMNKNICIEYMMINKNTPRVTRTKIFFSKKGINFKQIVGKFRIHS